MEVQVHDKPEGVAETWRTIDSGTSIQKSYQNMLVPKQLFHRINIFLKFFSCIFYLGSSKSTLEYHIFFPIKCCDFLLCNLGSHNMVEV